MPSSNVWQQTSIRPGLSTYLGNVVSSDVICFNSGKSSFSCHQTICSFSQGLVLSLGVAQESNGEVYGNPLQCSCLKNPRDGGAWWAAVYGVTQSRTRLKQLSSSSSSRNPRVYSLESGGTRVVWSTQ